MVIGVMKNRCVIPARYARCAALALALALSAPAAAQSMDYAALEQLFGEPVTMSATGSPQRAADAPTDLTILSADDIRRSGARDIPGILRHVGGIDTVQWTANASGVSIRGYNQAYTSQTLVLVDGRQVYPDFFALVPWGALPVELSDIRQIEVVKGPSTALFSLNAVSGVVNIITKNPRYEQGNDVSVRTGTQGLAEITGGAGFDLGGIGALRLSGGYFTGSEFDTPKPSGMTPMTRRENYRAAVAANAVFPLGAATELSVEGGHTHISVNDVMPGLMMQVSRNESNSARVQLLADTPAGLVRLAAYGNWVNWRGVSNSIFALDYGNRIIDALAEDVFGIGTGHTFRLAVEYRHNEVNTAPVRGGHVFYDMVSGSAMWNWQISPELSLTSALRFDHVMLGRRGALPPDYPFANANWNRDIDAFDFNNGLVWQASENDTLRLIAGRAVRLPNFVESGAISIGAGGLNMTGDPAIDPTVVTDYEIAWSHRLPDWNARLSVTAFHQHSRDMTSLAGDYTVTAGGIYFLSANIGSSDANGVELNLGGMFGDAWRWSVAYRAEYIDDNFTMPLAYVSDQVDYEKTTPKHLVKANLGWAADGWETDIYAIFQSRTCGMETVSAGFNVAAGAEIPAYVTADARVAYRLTGWATIAVSGQNLLQHTQRQSSGAEIERSVFITLTLEG
jgi:outer membrane receptor for ferrienterochelin and colicins